MSRAPSPGKRLFCELRRRRVFRTAALYIVGTWLVLQVADVVFPALDIPERAIRYLLLAALLGFPAALVFGWFYDVGAYGIRRTPTVGPEESDAAQALRLSDYLILTALAAVTAAILYNVVGNVVETPGQVQRAERDGPPMVAVLPFTAASIEGDNEFFAVGVHDDLLTQLAQLQSMRVISRTSVLEYKDTVRNIREIGAALGADAILEGGVQSAGGRIRINAQLIDARTDEHLWAQTYDRELSPANIFDVQSEIARAIASALQATLTVQDDSQLSVIPTENLAAYRAYRRAMEIRDTQGAWLVPAYREALEEAVELDPTFTRAMAELAGNLSFANYFYEVDPELTRRAETMLEQIRTLAPNSADYLIAQAYYTYYTLKDYDRALEFVTRAQGLMPSGIRLLELKHWIQRRQGDFEGRIETLRLMGTLDPKNPGPTISLVGNLMMSHRYEEAEAEIENATFEEYGLAYWRSVLQLREHRDLERWAEAVAEIHEHYEEASDPQNLWEAHIARRDFDAAEKSLLGLEDQVRGSLEYLPPRTFAQIITYHFSGQGEPLQQLLTRARATLGKYRDSNDNLMHYGLNLDGALVAAVEGNTEEAGRQVRRFQRGASEDLASQTLHWHVSCRMLGMAGATTAAVDCIRSGLEQVSMVFPFLEPMVPYYDLIRDEPEFLEMLEDLDGARPGPG